LVLEQAEQNIYYSTGEWLNNLINIDNYKEALQQLNFYQQLLIKYPPVHLLKHHAQPFHALVFNELRLISETNDKISYLLYYLGRYLDAITFCENSLNIYQFLLGENEYPTVASSNNLALLYAHTERYIEAEYLFKKTLAILEQQFNYLPNVATLLNNLGWLYYVQARYEEAEPLFLKSLAIKENTLEKNHPDIARTLNLLAAVYYYQRKYGEANSLYLKSLAIWEATVGKNHPDVARVLNSVALLNTVQGKYERAETLYMRSLEILEEILGIEHPTTKKAKLTYEQFLAEKAAREKSNQP
jgi:tetratricopeptide (TPR) repeat protein